MNDVHLLDRFYSEIYCHLLTNFLDLPSRPIVLGISGRPGDGKSSQLVASLQRENVKFTRIHAADLESGLAGEPGKLIARMYLDASQAIGRGEPWALILDDIDTTVGEWSQNTGTVNHQQVLAELMHLADTPIDDARRFPRRVPFFVTGNRLRALYGPVRRYRRFRHFPWAPTKDEILEVAQVLLHGYSEPGAAEQLVRAYPGCELAFYAEVKHFCIEQRVSTQLPPGEVNLGHLVRHAKEYRARLRLDRLTASELLAAGSRLSAATRNGLRNTVDIDHMDTDDVRNR